MRFPNAPEPDHHDEVRVRVVCPMCMGIPQTVVTTKCGHLFCQACIDNYMKNKTEANCPLCQLPFTKDSIRPDLNLQRHIDFLTVQCSNDGCGWTGEHRHLAHHRRLCPEEVVLCPHHDDGCQEAVKRKDMQLHLDANKEKHLKLQLATMNLVVNRSKMARLKQLEEYVISLNRFLVALPINEDGTLSRSDVFHLCGERWKLECRKLEDRRALYLRVVSKTEWAGSFSFTVMSTTDKVENITRSGTGEPLKPSWGFSNIIPNDVLHQYAPNSTLFVEVKFTQPPKTSES